MKDLKPKIDQIIFDLRAHNYGLAEERLFMFLDDLDALQKKAETYEEKWIKSENTPSPYNWR